MNHPSAKRSSPLDPVRVLGRGLRARRGVRMTMRMVREASGKTQVDVGEATGMDQADVSRLEKRTVLSDCQIATLERYVLALGGQLEVVARFGDKRIVLVGAASGTSEAAPTAAQQRPAGRKIVRR